MICGITTTTSHCHCQVAQC